MADFDKLSKIIGLDLSDKGLIDNAFVHRSFLNETKKKLSSNERLEFLGDSILSYVVSKYLFQKYGNLSEGELTNIRSSIVKTATLAEVSRNLALGNYLLLSKGEEESGGRQNKSILADTFEALIGGLFLEFGISKTETVIMDVLIHPFLPSILEDKLYIDIKSRFQELVQEREKTSPIYKVVNEEGPDHAKLFTVAVMVNQNTWGEGKGRNKHEAEQKAAAVALNKWKNTYNV